VVVSCWFVSICDQRPCSWVPQVREANLGLFSYTLAPSLLVSRLPG
jgi:hypothetical protein